MNADNVQSCHDDYSLDFIDPLPTTIDLAERVNEQHVALESLFVRGLSAYGTIRVNNQSFDKHVFVRYTIDQWHTVSMIDAYHSMFYFESNTDSFQFQLCLPLTDIRAGQWQTMPNSIIFVICYQTIDQTFWDNNRTRNYTLHIRATYITHPKEFC
jgi:hypothetical protein